MTRQLLVVRIGTSQWGMPPDRVSEIIARPRLTRIPQTAETLAGVAVVRGQPLPVVVPHPLWGDVPPDPMRQALRWMTDQGPVLVGVDAVETLWTVTEDPLSPSAWTGVVPPDLQPLIEMVYRRDAEWIWVAPPTWPMALLQRGGSHYAMV